MCAARRSREPANRRGHSQSTRAARRHWCGRGSPAQLFVLLLHHSAADGDMRDSEGLNTNEGGA